WRSRLSPRRRRLGTRRRWCRRSCCPRWEPRRRATELERRPPARPDERARAEPTPGIDMNQGVGRTGVLVVTLDCRRLDVARACLEQGRTPNLAGVLPPSGWEARETPGTFTLPAHLAFFHGFLPTPLAPGPHARLFALEFDGSLSTAATTYVFRGVDN